MPKDRIYIYDSTLRDGAQTSGVDFTTADKKSIAIEMDKFGIDYIEGGWPGSNLTDDEFFDSSPKLKKSSLVAFGMTRRPKVKAADDKAFMTLFHKNVSSICLVGKSWDFHVKKAIETTLPENIEMVKDSIELVVNKKYEAMFDAEHFFDGYKANPEYAMKVIKAAYEAGARWIVLCDTNGGTLPHEVFDIVTEISKTIPGKNLGIHCHNDTENSVANSIAAINAGARQVQGTLNGVGERCGNTNLISLIPTLVLKMGYDTGIKESQLKHLVKISRFLDEKLNIASDEYAPYVGASAFAHKGGLHVSAVAKDASSYEHINPELVGNQRAILVSKQAGRSNIISRLTELGFDVSKYEKSKINEVVKTIKDRESKGYAYDNANASFTILAKQILEGFEKFPYFKMEKFRVIDERRWDGKNKLVTLSEATIHINIDGKEVMAVAEGNGPVNALDHAIKKALITKYKQLKNIHLIDYKVRIINPGDGTGAITRVLIESEDDKGKSWITVGVSANIIDASYNALRDSITYKLMQ